MAASKSIGVGVNVDDDLLEANAILGAGRDIDFLVTPKDVSGIDDDTVITEFGNTGDAPSIIDKLNYLHQILQNSDATITVGPPSEVLDTILPPTDDDSTITVGPPNEEQDTIVDGGNVKITVGPSEEPIDIIVSSDEPFITVGPSTEPRDSIVSGDGESGPSNPSTDVPDEDEVEEPPPAPDHLRIFTTERDDGSYSFDATAVDDPYGLGLGSSAFMAWLHERGDRSGMDVEYINRDNVIQAGDENDTISADPGYGRMAVGSGDWTIRGGDDIVHGNGGDDTLGGDGGLSFMWVVNGSNLIYGGNDILYGGSGDDRLLPDGHLHVLAAEAVTLYRGNDVVYGGDGSDVIGDAELPASVTDTFGNSSHVTLHQGSDTLYGGAGDDTIYATDGDDALYGGEGIDAFVFGVGWGRDIVGDFEVGIDQISFAELDAADVAVSEINGNVVIVLAGDPDSAVTLLGLGNVDVSDDLIFGS